MRKTCRKAGSRSTATRLPTQRLKTMPTTKHFEIYAGEDRTLSLVARDANVDILNLTGATLAFRMTKTPGDSATVSASGSITSASVGTFTVALTDSQTDVDAGDYTYHVLATISGTDTLCSLGKIRVKALNQA